MREEIYQWMKNLAVFYILFTAALHLAPDSKYEKYIRFFMGLLLIVMLCTPVFSLLGKGGELMESFRGNYEEETLLRQQEELENIQILYLKKGIEREITEKIREVFENQGIKLTDAAVHIEGERVTALLTVEGALTEEQERGLENGLREACGIQKGDYQIQTAVDGPPAVDRASASGTASDSDRNADLP
ncbi:MAG: stage III sporulation protein AF [Eubacteriales bacterium]|nr:stage III sporulation protein AF [Eubacteriales bacterium]